MEKGTLREKRSKITSSNAHVADFVMADQPFFQSLDGICRTGEKGIEVITLYYSMCIKYFGVGTVFPATGLSPTAVQRF